MKPLTAKELHDLSGACIDFKILLDLIKSGYRFDDEEAPILLDQLEKDLKVLQNHLHEMKE